MRFIPTNIILYFFLAILGMSGVVFAVIWPQAIGFYIFIAFAAVGGLGVAVNIYYTKRRNKQLICPIGSDCNAVINSQYAKFLGIPLEYCGMFYYAIILISYLFLIFIPHIFSNNLSSALIILTAGAFLFSLYLLFVQAFILKKWCIWCLLSAMLSIGIFIVSLAKVDFAVTFFMKVETIIEIIHTLGFVIGMGGATITLFLFFKFLRDFKIDETELKILQGISEFVWLGLVLVLVSQFISYVVYPNLLASSGLFLIETLALLVVAVTGAILLIIFAPLLSIIPFSSREDKNNNLSPLETLKKQLFVLGAITVSSWYFAFIMNYLSEYSFSNLFLVYLVVLMTASFLSLLIEKNINKKNFDIS